MRRHRGLVIDSIISIISSFRMIRRLLACCAAVLLAQPAIAAEPIPVIAGNTVLHDLAARIGGEAFTVSSLLGPGVDPHAYQPVPDDVRRLSAARVIILNGMGFEGWFQPVAREAALADRVVLATRGIAELTMAEACAGHGAGHAATHHHAHQVPDPHAWNSLRMGIVYVENIRDALVTAAPEAAAGIRARADALVDELHRTDAWATAQIAAIPRARRIIVTNHEALAYFARDYGFSVRSLTTALESGEPSAAHLAEIIAFIRAQQVPSVFLEHGTSPRLIEQIAAEAGVRVAAPLHLDGLGAVDGPAATYVGMFRSNVDAIVAALR
jgi:zinc/manganese transport system substrate-binding protein